MVGYTIEPCESWGKHVLQVWTDRGWETIFTGYMHEVEHMIEVLQRMLPTEAQPPTPRQRIKNALENLQIAIRELPPL